MGNDGGIKISKIIDIKENWASIRKKMIDESYKKLDYILNRENYQYEIQEAEEIINECEKFPKNIEKLDDVQLINLFNRFQSCDCPYLFEDKYIITAEGDNIPSIMIFLSRNLPGVSIETWT